jgi:flagellar biosynthesis protein FlhB
LWTISPEALLYFDKYNIIKNMLINIFRSDFDVISLDKGAPVRVMDLQIFSQEKTEEATPKKERKEREEGRVAHSRDLTSSVMLVTGTLFLFGFSGLAWSIFRSFLADTIGLLPSIGQGKGDWINRLPGSWVLCFFKIWLPLSLVVLVAALLVVSLQVGLKISPKPLIPKMDRFSLVKGLKKMFSFRSFVEAFKAVLKAAILFAVLFFGLKNEFIILYEASRLDVSVGIVFIFTLLFRLALRLALALFVLGLFDYTYQRWEHSRSIRMSKQEIRDEFKQTEGDPLVRQRIRRKQHELGQHRMMSRVPEADVVVANPTHLAIALKYEREKMGAPVVLAKGAGFIALKIREIAGMNGIPVVEEKSLARGLYPRINIGEEIPEEFYVAVAEVLAYVYSLEKKKSL